MSGMLNIVLGCEGVMLNEAAPKLLVVFPA